MDADIDYAAQLASGGCEMRVGRKLRRTLYLHPPHAEPDHDLCVGIVDSEALAAEIVRRWNGY